MGYNPSEKQVSDIALSFTARAHTRLPRAHHRFLLPALFSLPLSVLALRLLGCQVAELAAACPNPERITSADVTRLTLSAPKPSASSEKDLLEAFRVFDRDENGLISLNELRVIFTTLGETISTDEANSILEQVAVDDNGKVKYAQFVSLIAR